MMGNDGPVGLPLPSTGNTVDVESPVTYSARNIAPAANRMLVVQLKTAVELQAPTVNIPLHITGHAVEVEVANRVRHEMHTTVAPKAESGNPVCPPPLVGDNAVIIFAHFDFRSALWNRNLPAAAVRAGIPLNAAVRCHSHRQARRVGNFKITVRRAAVKLTRLVSQ